jgi:hypothetical protein
MNRVPNILPAGFKHVPSNMLFAVSRDGRVINAQTHLSIRTTVDDDGVAHVTFYTYDPKVKKNERIVMSVYTLIDEAFGVEWADIPGYPAYKISRDGLTVVNKSTKTSVPIYQETVPIFKSGRDLIPDVWLIEDLLKLAFPEKEDVPETPRREARLTNRSKTITVNNAAIAREALMQIQRTKGRHYPGPLRDQTIWDLIDHLVEELTEPEESMSNIWKSISGYSDYEVNADLGEVRNRWSHAVMSEKFHNTLELRHVSGEWREISLVEILKLAK